MSRVRNCAWVIAPKVLPGDRCEWVTPTGKWREGVVRRVEYVVSGYGDGYFNYAVQPDGQHQRRWLTDETVCPALSTGGQKR